MVEDFISMQDLASVILRPGCLAGGELKVTASPKGVRRVELFETAPTSPGGPPRRTENSACEILERACSELDRYFSGEKITFRSPLDFDGSGTPFQLRVWKALFEIPRGEFRTYGELAARVGSPRAARAVGQAVGQNPLPVIFPCHRVISGDGRLGGFSCGVRLKVLLLELEGLAVAGSLPLPGSRWSALRMS